MSSRGVLMLSKNFSLATCTTSATTCWLVICNLDTGFSILWVLALRKHQKKRFTSAVLCGTFNTLLSLTICDASACVGYPNALRNSPTSNTLHISLCVYIASLSVTVIRLSSCCSSLTLLVSSTTQSDKFAIYIFFYKRIQGPCGPYKQLLTRTVCMW